MNIVGIDLGTTYSAVAALDDRGQPVTLPNRDGDMLTPSAVLLTDDGAAIVGQAAIDVAQEQPERVAMLVKRRMGHETFGRTVAGKNYRPETLSAIILRKLVQDAELRLGKISKAVITVPAYFDDTRRKATHDAGRIAGLDVLDILDEPTAAALAYSFQRGQSVPSPHVTLTDEPQTVMVYDLGGGTFDVTIVRLLPKRFQVLAIEGDVRLGGKDWDDRIVNHVAEAFFAKFGEDPRNDAQSLVVLQTSAERAKRTLSKLDQASVTCNHAGRKLAVPITRREFESLTRDLMTRTRLTTQQVLKQANLTWDQIDKVLLVGGSTHMPMAGNMLRDVTGRPPDNSLAVSEVVARGAAIHAGIAMAKFDRKTTSLSPAASEALADVIEISVNAHSLGIEVRKEADRINDVLIGKNTQLPAASSRVYYTLQENQSRVRVRVLQGEAQQADACIPVGECWIDGLPPVLPKGSPVQVRCAVNPNGLIDVMALDMTSGRMARAEIHRSTGLSDEEIAKESDWVKSLRIQ
jgi:molecular chaperone DnaK